MKCPRVCAGAEGKFGFRVLYLQLTAEVLAALQGVDTRSAAGIPLAILGQQARKYGLLMLVAQPACPLLHLVSRELRLGCAAEFFVQHAERAVLALAGGHEVAG